MFPALAGMMRAEQPALEMAEDEMDRRHRLEPLGSGPRQVDGVVLEAGPAVGLVAILTDSRCNQAWHPTYGVDA